MNDATRPVIVLQLWAGTSAGATLIETLDEYADDLEEAGGRLYRSGVSAELAAQLRRAAMESSAAWLTQTVVYPPSTR